MDGKKKKNMSGPLIKKIKFSISEPSGYESMGGERLIYAHESYRGPIYFMGGGCPISLVPSFVPVLNL